MKMSLTALCMALLISSGGSALAGKINQGLVQKMAATPGDSTITVLIKLPRFASARSLKASVNASSKSRAGRYANAARRLKENHASAQSGLLQRLRALEVRQLVTNIRPYWIANMVAVDIRIDQIDHLSRRPDIEVIYDSPEILFDLPETEKELSTDLSSASVAEPNLTYINADQAWAAGYTGAGRLVCSFDTGVRGIHIALTNSWKGNDGDSAAAWFDPRFGESYPHQASTDHGTHTMGIMVGHTATDTVGVAIGAKWISAAVMDVDGASLIDGFEWVADPDGNPNTVGDVPDVIGHSWGVQDIACENMFYDLIDNLEALGIVNIFSAGNEGYNPFTIRNPANRANDSLDCFAIGNIDQRTTPPLIYSSSSRGPSDCFGEGIKPNVCAPGYRIRSSILNSSYGLKTGTSMAAPHVAGLVALLRQKNPDATVDEIKTAILTTTQTYDWNDLPNNDFGWGVIDCMAALNALPAAGVDPELRVYTYDHPTVAAGGTISGTIVLQNLGGGVSNVAARIIGTNDALTILADSAYFGTIGGNDTTRSSDLIQALVADSVSDGSALAIDLLITGDGGYSRTVKLYFIVGDRLQRSMKTVMGHNIQFTISNFGTYGFGPGSFFPAGGGGFTVGGGNNHLYECGLMIGLSPDYVSDGVRNVIGEPDGDFKVAPGGNLIYTSPTATAFEETVSRFTDARAESPMSIEVTQKTFTYTTLEDNNLVIMQYILKNNNAALLYPLYVGIYADWDDSVYNRNAGGYDAASGLLWTAYNNTEAKLKYRGLKLLHGELSSALTQTSSAIIYPEGFTEAEKFLSLIAGTGSAETYANSQTDVNQIMAAGPLTLSPGGIDTVAFAFVAGLDSATFAKVALTASYAASAYNDIVLDVEQPGEQNLPTSFSLHQNFPNPFNPTTTITFDLPRASDYTLTIYNLLGGKVEEAAGHARAGRVKYVWNARGYASGVYLYRIDAGDYTASRKMMLLK